MLKEVVELIWLLFILDKKECKRYLDFSIKFNVIFFSFITLCCMLRLKLRMWYGNFKILFMNKDVLKMFFNSLYIYKWSSIKNK